MGSALRPRRAMRKPPHRVSTLLAWADAHRDRTGHWPTEDSGRVFEARDESWAAIDMAPRDGLRGLPRGLSLARLLERFRHKRNHLNLPPLSYEQILRWADDHRRRTGHWPQHTSGRVPGTNGETWGGIVAAISMGLRGLPGGYTLANLLADRRRHRNVNNLPRLTIKQILTWADDHHARAGTWPSQHAGEIPGTNGEDWERIDAALLNGHRGLRPGSSIKRLLAKHRHARNMAELPPLTIDAILVWADFHQRATGSWPKATSGRVGGAPGETWASIQHALCEGRRALPAGLSIARLLHEHRGVRFAAHAPMLTVKQLLLWADEHHARTGQYPRRDSGEIADTDGETWRAIDTALYNGLRGLPGSSSLAQFLERRREKPPRRPMPNAPPALSEAEILSWADRHYRRTGAWPTQTSRAIAGAPGETWRKIHQALYKGYRGFPGGDSLAQLLDRCRQR